MMSGERWVQDAVFRAAWAYDLAFSWQLGPEVDLLLALARLEAPGRLLLPACGTGRFAEAFGSRGFSVEASDLNPEMLAYAKEHRSHALVSYALADMTCSLGDVSDCDAAFTPCNSFRYVLDDEGVRGHLSAVSSRLRRGAPYILELAMNVEDPAILNVPHVWTIERDGWRAVARWTVTSFTFPLSMEVAEIEIEGCDGRVHEVRENQPQRLWRWRDLERVVKVAGLDVSGVYASDGTRAADPSAPGRYYVALVRS
jgi:SAM-dependent methyltransferase